MDFLPFQYKKRPHWEYYCPVCSVLRRSFYKPSPRLRHYFQLLFFAVILTAALWPLFRIKGIFLLFPIIAVFEFGYRSRARQSLICTHCGFDPYLYKFDVGLARQKVEKYFKELEERKAKALEAKKPNTPEVSAVS